MLIFNSDGGWRLNWSLLLIFLLDFRVTLCQYSTDTSPIVLARINVSYTEPGNNSNTNTGYFYGEFGRFANNAIGSASGVLVIGEYSNDTIVKIQNRQWCSLSDIEPPINKPWIALFLTGGCTDAKKVSNAYKLNASAVLLYGYDLDNLTEDKSFKDGAVVVIILPRHTSHTFTMTAMVEKNFKLNIEIVMGRVLLMDIPSRDKIREGAGTHRPREQLSRGAAKGYPFSSGGKQVVGAWGRLVIVFWLLSRHY